MKSLNKSTILLFISGMPFGAFVGISIYRIVDLGKVIDLVYLFLAILTIVLLVIALYYQGKHRKEVVSKEDLKSISDIKVKEV